MMYRSTRWSLLATLSVPWLAAAALAASGNWPSFRGPNGSGVADGQAPPVQWNVETGVNIRWKTPIPGLGHSSPIVWDDHVFLTSAVTEREPYLRPGLYGESPDNPERFTHHYRVYCLNKDTGQIVWERTAHSGFPQVARHIKSSHANSTPATDGTHMVACFGSEGLCCYDSCGEPLWHVDLGYLDSGAFDAPEIQWGFGSSPIIHDNRVIVVCDTNSVSFIAAYDVRTGKGVWRTWREEMPTWGTPAIAQVEGRTLVIVNGWKHIGAYDAQTGAEVWRLRGGGDIPVPTPVVAHELAFITNAHGGQSPIYAIRLTARGDITLQGEQTASEHVAWSLPRRGAYIPTPIVYGDYLYVGNDRGILTCYQATTGEQVYRTRISESGGTYSASAVAAGGRLYFTSEEGDVHVVEAGPEYKLLATNSMAGVCLATPAISDSALFVRTSKELYAIGDTGGERAPTASQPAATDVKSVTPAAASGQLPR